ncbi:MAG: raffinose/stachyose/melibiose transport system substrate-binding protein [Clostridiales bacterium]|nr:raffinose/stachyose/melibiose transport system substrate-binding protein [Clostridiales bacterium]
MKAKKMIATTLVLALTSMIFTGCGSSTDSSSKVENGVTKLEFFSSKMENVSTMQKLVDQFNEENKDIQVTLNAPADAGTVLKTRMTKDDLPDIIAYGGDNTYTELTDAGILVDLKDQDFMKSINESYMQTVYDINAGQEKKAYGIPFATNASGIIYNVDLFKKANVAVPKTWDELIQVCDALTAAGITPFELSFKDSWTILPSWNSLAPAIQPDGFLAAKKEGKATFLGTHEEVLQKYSKIVSYAQNDFMGTSYDDGNRNFANGEAAMLINGVWAVSEIKKTNPDIHMDMFAYPATNDPAKNKVVSGIDVMLMVTKQCKNPDAAKRFLAFLLKPENSQTYIDEQFAFSPVSGVVQKDASVAGLANDIAEGKVTDFVDHYYPSGYDLSAILSEFFLNQANKMDENQNIEATLKSCDEQYDILNVQ